MENKTKAIMENADPGSDDITNDDIAAYATDSASPQAARRVAAGAVFYPSVRARVSLLRELSEGYAAASSGDNEPAIQAAQLQRFQMRALAAATTVPYQAASAVPPGGRDLLGVLQAAAAQGGGGLWRLADEALSALTNALATTPLASRALVTGTSTLSLPCLAPALAAAAPDPDLRRESVTTADGVRIEFQQLPGALARVRLLVDASSLNDTPAYDAALVTLEEQPGGSARAAARHILVVALNEQGRGFTDFVVGSSPNNDAAHNFPAPGGAYRLTAATLTRLF